MVAVVLVCRGGDGDEGEGGVDDGVGGGRRSGGGFGYDGEVGAVVLLGRGGEAAEEMVVLWDAYIGGVMDRGGDG
ncbi:hypothetical protein Tco_1251359 [Tanacetum coccineum]